MEHFLDHRLGSRNTVAIPTRVYHRNENTRSATITNLSMAGAFAELDDEEQLPIDDIVKIRFSLTENGLTHQLFLPAIVIHHDAEGLGIMFVNEEQEFCQTLKKMMHAHQLEQNKTKPERNNIIPIKRTPDRPVADRINKGLPKSDRLLGNHQLTTR